MIGIGRSPLGLRGLKFIYMIYGYIITGSQPSWAAWIEIFLFSIFYTSLYVAALLGCVD